jgi:hypothetical protein
VGLGLVQEGDQRELVKEIALAQMHPVLQVRDPLEVVGRSPAHHPIDGVALLEKKLREVGAVLAGDACDESPSLRHDAQIVAERGLTQ